MNNTKQLQEELQPDKRLSLMVRRNLDQVVKNRLNKDFDFVLVICGSTKSGGVGDGKSTLAQLVNAYVSLKTTGTFTIDYIIFSYADYTAINYRLKPKDVIQFDEGEEMFFSRSTARFDQQQLIKRLAQIRDQLHFIIICVPSILMLEKWLRGTGTETRVSCLWRIVRRGVFYSYSSKTGSLQRIKLDPKTNSLIYPQSDFIGFWQPIPKKTTWWRNYRHKKDYFKLHLGRDPKVDKLIEAEQDRLKDTLTIRDIAEINKVSVTSVHRWLRLYKVFKPKYVFKDLSGTIRIKLQEYKRGVIRLQKIKRG